MESYKNSYRPLEEVILFRPISEAIARALKNSRIHPTLFTITGFLITCGAGLSFLTLSLDPISRIFLLSCSMLLLFLTK